MKNVVIFGTGGHAKVIYDIVIKSNDRVVAFIDEYKEITDFLGIPVYRSLHEIVTENDYVIVAIGDNLTREKIYENYRYQWYTAIHPTSIIGQDVVIEEGAMILAGTILNSNCHIGKGTIINSGTIIEHDCEIGNYVHVSPHGTVCGTCKIGDRTWIGASATVINNISITSDVIVGAGSLVIKDIVNKGKYVGIPCRKTI